MCILGSVMEYRFFLNSHWDSTKGIGGPKQKEVYVVLGISHPARFQASKENGARFLFFCFVLSACFGLLTGVLLARDE